MKRLHVLIEGDVQGVGYRAFARDQARRRGIAGWTRNLRDGRVEATGEGEEASLRDWLGVLRRGPAGARVDTILPVWAAPRGVAQFEIRPTADREDREA